MSKEKVFKLGDKLFDPESITENGNSMIHDLQLISELLSQQKLQVSVTEIAKRTLYTQLKEESKNFKEI